MPDNEQIMLFRSIRNAPATILLLLIVRGASMTGREIAGFTGYSDKTVTDAMRTLDALGFTQNNGRAAGWSLHAGQLQLPGIHSLGQSVEKEIVKFTISATSSSSSATNGNAIKGPAVAAEIDRKIYDLLVSAGVGGHSKKMRELLAADLDPHVVAAHVEARLQRPDEISIGLLIRKLLDGDPPPARRKNKNQIPAMYADIVKR